MARYDDPFGPTRDDIIASQNAAERAKIRGEAGVTDLAYRMQNPQRAELEDNQAAASYAKLQNSGPYNAALRGAHENIQGALGKPPPMTEFVKDPRDNTEAGEEAYKQHIGDYQKTVQDWSKTQPGYQPPAGQAAQPTQNIADPLGAQPATTAPTPFKNDRGVEISSTYAAAYPGTASAMGYAAPSGTTPATTAPTQPPAPGAAPGQAPQPAPTSAAAPLAPKPPTTAGRSIMAGTYGAGANNSYGMGSGWDQEKYDRPLG
jgi:hypothetical protein